MSQVLCKQGRLEESAVAIREGAAIGRRHGVGALQSLALPPVDHRAATSSRCDRHAAAVSDGSSARGNDVPALHDERRVAFLERAAHDADLAIEIIRHDLRDLGVQALPHLRSAVIDQHAVEGGINLWQRPSTDQRPG